ncbi:aminotransferase class III-fold pyridoxal phosphate-dependent enzyme (plasmid) [Photobacterium sp. DA100]|uniref:aminotransferase class III-fold pyridoxal phosphate-dependent enzyme n=1 Tax=Photobacterium sp. DA100 TaxID=3027472 RepID=UPI002479CABD|nr:aminotransferase class III-fold pyridoxal phosphate-dependent enzyme [Photobacterium sp. DA100]WEM44641.1 aminotransferase class III-fold pyridoxal phosphate-dependent enzyme [Photobacterium sp. DA100]
MNHYLQYCKPSLSAALTSIGLDKVYHRAEGQYLYYSNSQGVEQQVLDLLGGYGAVLFGHNDPEFRQQAVGLLQANTPFHHQFSIRSGAGALAEKLQPLLRKETGWSEPFRCAFTSTGAESVEIAIKHSEMSRGQKLELLSNQSDRALEQLGLAFEENAMLSLSLTEAQAMLYPELATASCDKVLAYVRKHNASVLQQPPVFIALEHAFHGKLTTSIQLTHGLMYRQPFRRLGLRTEFVSIAQLDTLTHGDTSWLDQPSLLLPKKTKKGLVLEDVAIPTVAAVLVEPVQGEGGVHALTEADAKVLHRVRDTLGCPLIADEVQSGSGRCGSFLAGSLIGLKPDYVVLSKALGAGLSKLGVVAIRSGQYADGFDILQSSTFAEDEMSCQLAAAYLDRLMEDDGRALSTVRDLGEVLFEALKGLHQSYPDVIKDIRGKGLLLGIEFQSQDNAPAHLIRTSAYQGALGYLLTGYLLNEHGIRVAPPASAGNVIRIEPTILLTQQQIDELINALERMCLALRYQDTGYLMHFLVHDEPHPTKEPKDFRPWYGSLGIEQQYSQPADSKVAFVNHLISSDWLRQVDASLQHWTDGQCDELVRRFAFDKRVAPFAPVRMKSSQGQTVDFILYPINSTSQQISEQLENNQLEPLRAAIDERLAAAKADGCRHAGLGMFTSIVMNNGKAAQTAGISLTTGNALTIAMAHEALLNAAQDRGHPIVSAAVIGAAGNIGSVYSLLVAEHCQQLTLVGSGRQGSVKRLQKVAYQIYQAEWESLQNPSQPAAGIASALQPHQEIIANWLNQMPDKTAGEAIFDWCQQHLSVAPVLISTDVGAIDQADTVICASNASDAFIDIGMIQQSAIVCDIAVPHNLSDSVLGARPDIRCIRGGIVQTPHNESLDPRVRAYLSEGQVYACMAETIVLGMEQYPTHYSYGNLTKEQVKWIALRAREHGMKLGKVKVSESM